MPGTPLSAEMADMAPASALASTSRLHAYRYVRWRSGSETADAAAVATGPQKIATPTSGGEKKSAAEASGYYHFSSSGKKNVNKWDSFDADAECAKVDADSGPEVVD